MTQKIFKDFDFSQFWDDSDYFLKEYVGVEPSDDLIRSIEDELGYKFPASYIEFMKLHNGGVPKLDAYPTSKNCDWDEYGTISNFLGIGRDKSNSLCGVNGSRFYIDKWGYPDTGIYICDCPSAGHDLIMLDYSKCGKSGEPAVVHVDQELDFTKTLIAKNFETFIRSLVNSDSFEQYEGDSGEHMYNNSEEEILAIIETIKKGRFSDVLQKYFKANTSINFDKVLRNLFVEMTRKRGLFDIEGDELSTLAIDIQFYLLTLNKTIRTKENYIKEYTPMVAMGNRDIAASGYSVIYAEKLFDQRKDAKQIVGNLLFGLKFSEQFAHELFERIKKYE